MDNEKRIYWILDMDNSSKRKKNYKLILANHQHNKTQHPRQKVLLCIWWDQGVLYYELLSSRQTIIEDYYSQQL